jgi:hypothetical protein
LFLEPNHPELAAGFRFQNRHHPIVFDFRLQMAILGRFLPKRVRFWLASLGDDISEALGFCFEKFHAKEKSARELRQGGSNYRCCIPALAGFVSPQSIAPDGKETYPQAWLEQRGQIIRGVEILTERQIRFDPRLVGLVEHQRLAELAFALRAFQAKKMAPRRLGTQNLAPRGNFEPFRDGFACFAASDGLGHEAQKIAQLAI